MIAFPTMLVSAAKEAGMSIPDDIKDQNIDSFADKHFHFYVFCLLPYFSW
jgi:hypothetical protein